MKEEKLEQLKKIFKKIIEEAIEDVEGDYNPKGNNEQYIKNIVNQLIYEVKIRINNK